MVDQRNITLAKNLVNYSCDLKKGQKILIEASVTDVDLVREIVKEVYSIGGEPFVQIKDERVQRELLCGLDENTCRSWAKYDEFRMKEMDAYIGIRGGNNSCELSDVPENKSQLYSKLYALPVHHNIRVAKTNWVILRYPTPAFAQLTNMSTEACEKFFYNVCNLDYGKMNKAMDPLKALMEKTDKVRIVAKDTDLSFSIKGMPAVKCAGERNIPDGEIYTAPIKDSVNGIISYNVPSIEGGFKFENVKLKFKDGKIIEATSNNNEKLNNIFDTDEGARYVGEFSFGLNPYITKAVGDILFDEKISGSIHFTPGACYSDADNKNQSAVHWDLVLAQTPEYGGGEIYFDDVLIRKDGRFVLKELECLNPENLK